MNASIPSAASGSSLLAASPRGRARHFLLRNDLNVYVSFGDYLVAAAILRLELLQLSRVVDFPAAEAFAPGVQPLLGDAVLLREAFSAPSAVIRVREHR